MATPVCCAQRRSLPCQWRFHLPCISLEWISLVAGIPSQADASAKGGETNRFNAQLVPAGGICPKLAPIVSSSTLTADAFETHIRFPAGVADIFAFVITERKTIDTYGETMTQFGSAKAKAKAEAEADTRACKYTRKGKCCRR